MGIRLEVLKPEDEAQFISDNQYAFKYGAEQYFSDAEMEGQYEEEGQIISRETIIHSIHADGAVAYRIMEGDAPQGGIIIRLEGEEGHLDILFVNPNCQSKGLGQLAWAEIERRYPEIKIWETVTPCFEKRNVHFYVNKLGFHITKYYNDHLPGCDEDLWEMFQFEKRVG